MAKSHKSGIGREILVERGLTEWFWWFGSTAGVHTLCNLGQSRSPAKYAKIAETANDIVVLLANIIQEAK